MRPGPGLPGLTGRVPDDSKGRARMYRAGHGQHVPPAPVRTAGATTTACCPPGPPGASRQVTATDVKVTVEVGQRHRGTRTGCFHDDLGADVAAPDRGRARLGGGDVRARGVVLQHEPPPACVVGDAGGDQVPGAHPVGGPGRVVGRHGAGRVHLVPGEVTRHPAGAHAGRARLRHAAGAQPPRPAQASAHATGNGEAAQLTAGPAMWLLRSGTRRYGRRGRRGPDQLGLRSTRGGAAAGPAPVSARARASGRRARIARMRFMSRPA